MLTIPEEVKELLKSDSVRKNFRISFPNGERADIINDNLIQESVSFTESVCSQNTLKYGLSEASTLSFRTVGVENIKGYVIDVEIEIDATEIADTVGNIQESDDVDYPYYPIPYGRFIVDSCKRSGELNQRQVECYTSEYIGISPFIEGWMDVSPYPFETYEIGDLKKFLVSCFFPYGITDDYISSSTAISATSTSTLALKEYAVYDADGNYIRFRDTVHTISSYNPHNISTDPVLAKVTVSKVNDADSIYNTALQTMLDYMGDTDYTYSPNGAKRYNSNEEAAKNILNHILAVYVSDYREYYLSSLTLLDTLEAKYCELQTGDNLIYGQCSTGTNYDYYQCHINVRTTGTIRMLTSSDYQDFTLGTIYQIDSAETIELTDDFGSFYSNRFTIKSTGSGTMTVSSGDAFTYYTYVDSLDMKALANAHIEMNGYYARPGRDGMSSILELTNDVTEEITASEYSSLWYAEDFFNYSGVTATYTKVDSDDETETQVTIIYGDRDRLYDMTSNIIFQNGNTSPSSFLSSYFMPKVLKSIYIPYNLTCIGLPYLEAGDYITVKDKEGNEFNSYILRQTISGIQHLTSSMEAQSVDV